MQFKLLQEVTITHPLFAGCVGQVFDFGADGGEILIKVEFLDKTDKVNKQIYFSEKDLKNRVRING